ncbi:MAG: ergothioneine biosynthesis protein EgtB [Solirubrobacteraceae bacterium]
MSAVASRSSANVIEALRETRQRTLALASALSDDQLERVYSTLMSPLVWDLAHIAAFEDLWLVHHYGERPLLHPGLAEIYDALQTPRASRGELEFLRPEPAREYLREVRAHTLEVIEQRGIGDGLLHELVIRHEQQHNETMLQAIQLARLSGYQLPSAPAGAEAAGAPADPAAPCHTGLELVEIPAGECSVGAGPEGFAYDNERPRHAVFVGSFAIGRTPITNAAFLAFVQDGGYRRRGWWTDAGWTWRRHHGIAAPGAWSESNTSEWRLGALEQLDPQRPVTSISWFEADAFARAHGARLPTEAEWEKAASWDPGLQRSRAFPWGDAPPVPGLHANLDHISPGPARVGCHPAGASPHGALDMIGGLWEWTASDFRNYPGFVADPYPEYSQAFFGADYKVLRGGSWATRARVITSAFRNWDFPQRRQIFAGFRIAKDA